MFENLLKLPNQINRINLARVCCELPERIIIQATIYRRLRIGRDGHLDQSEAYEIYRNFY